MKKLRWVWILGIAVCLGLFAFLSAERQKPSFADKIPMLKGLHPNLDRMQRTYSLYPDLHLSGRIRTQEFVVDVSYKTANEQLKRELPASIRLDTKYPLRSFYSGTATPFDGGLRIRAEKAYGVKTRITVDQDVDLTWVDRMLFWWSNLTGGRPPK